MQYDFQIFMLNITPILSLSGNYGLDALVFSHASHHCLIKVLKGIVCWRLVVLEVGREERIGKINGKDPVENALALHGSSDCTN